METHSEREYIAANSAFESVWYICPCIGSLISACLSLIDIKTAMFVFHIVLSVYLIFSTIGIALYFISFVYAVFLIRNPNNADMRRRKIAVPSRRRDAGESMY